jgi:hypothetical protein
VTGDRKPQPARRVVKRWVLWVTSPDEPLGAWPDPGDGGGGKSSRVRLEPFLGRSSRALEGFLVTLQPSPLSCPLVSRLRGPMPAPNGSRATAALVLGPVPPDCGVLRKRQ